MLRRAVHLPPGLLVCLGLAGAARALQRLELHLFGRAWLEALVLAILLGAGVRTAWTPGPRCAAGIKFAAKTVLEAAVVLLGATIDGRTVLAAGPPLLAGVAAVVALGLASSYGLGRLFRLPRRMAVLIACGNAICGNSAIAAVAPVIDADGDDVTAAIAFTAVLGVGVVLGLPALAAALHMGPRGFGVFAGLTVYAVPQVLAATAPAGPLAVQVGTLVKLVRVLLLGPVVAALSLAGLNAGPDRVRPQLHHLAPWFILGFLTLAAARTAAPVPQALVAAAGATAGWLTIVSMAALGLGVDVRALVRAGPRVSAVVTLSLCALGAFAFLLVRALPLA